MVGNISGVEDTPRTNISSETPGKGRKTSKEVKARSTTDIQPLPKNNFRKMMESIGEEKRNKVEMREEKVSDVQTRAHA